MYIWLEPTHNVFTRCTIRVYDCIPRTLAEYSGVGASVQEAIAAVFREAEMPCLRDAWYLPEALAYIGRSAPAALDRFIAEGP